MKACIISTVIYCTFILLALFQPMNQPAWINIIIWCGLAVFAPLTFIIYLMKLKAKTKVIMTTILLIITLVSIYLLLPVNAH